MGEKEADVDAARLLKEARDATDDVPEEDLHPGMTREQVEGWLNYAREHPQEGDLERFPKGAFAGPGRRVLAYLMDVLIVVPTMLIFAWILGTFPEKPPVEAESVGLFGLKGGTARLVTALIQLVIYDVYFTATVFRWGGTWGQKFTGTIVLNRDLAMPAKWQARRRYWAMVLAMIPFGLGLLAILWDRRRRGWHDHMVKTYVVRLDGVTPQIVHAASRRTRDKSESLEDTETYTRALMWFILLMFAPGLIALGLIRLLLGKLGLVGKSAAQS